MALVAIRESRDVVEDGGDVKELLEAHGIRHAFWDTARLPGELRGRSSLDEVQKARVLELYRREIEAEKTAFGYVTADVVSLAPDNPKLDEICARFDKEHTHDEDEVRLVVAGHGTFTVRGRSGEAIDITLGPGDYISVPRDRRHWFTLLADRTIVAVRLFQDTKGWTPRYAGEGTGATRIPAERIARAFGAAAAGTPRKGS